MVFELELIQTQITQKPMLRAEVYARALVCRGEEVWTPPLSLSL